MSGKIEYLIRSHGFILTCLLILQLSSPAEALEGFRFVVRNPVDTEHPACFTSLGSHPGFVVYDDKSRHLVFLNENFKKTNTISLSQPTVYSPDDIISLRFDQSRDRIIVFDAGKRFILVFKIDGTLQHMFDMTVKLPDYFAYFSTPTSMAIDTQGTVYVSDNNENDIKAFTLDGTYLFSMHLPLSVEGEKSPFAVSALTVLADGTVVAVDSEAHNIVLFSREGRFISERTLEGDYSIVKKLITLANGELLGVDDEQRILKWTVRGKQTAGLGSKGASRGQFLNLADITCDNAGNIVAMDNESKDFQIFRFDSPSHHLPVQKDVSKFRIKHTTTETASGKVVGLLPNGVILFDPSTKVITLKQGDRSQEFKHPDIKNITTVYVNDSALYAFDQSREKTFVFKLPNGYFAFDCGEGKLEEVTRILPAPGNSLIFSDEDDTKIKIFNEDGIMSAEFGSDWRAENSDSGFAACISMFRMKLPFDEKR